MRSTTSLKPPSLPLSLVSCFPHSTSYPILFPHPSQLSFMMAFWFFFFPILLNLISLLYVSTELLWLLLLCPFLYYKEGLWKFSFLRKEEDYRIAVYFGFSSSPITCYLCVLHIINSSLCTSTFSPPSYSLLLNLWIPKFTPSSWNTKRGSTLACEPTVRVSPLHNPSPIGFSK